MPIFNAQLIKIDPIETRRYAGLSNAKNFDEQSIINACEEAQLLIDVRGIWKIYDYDSKTQIILSEPPVEIIGKSIGKHLNSCDKVICLAVTIGEEIENEVSKRFSKGEYVDSILLDAAATSAVEQAADAIEKAIAQEISRQGYVKRWRFSPGYGDWPLTQQPELFRLAGAREIGMELSTALMLIPRKSITAIIGLVKNQVVCNSQIDNTKNKAAHNCTACNKVDCNLRQI